MKKTFIGLSTAVALVFSICLYAQAKWAGRTMPVGEVKNKWGSEKFEPMKFKTGGHEVRAKMAFTMMTDKNLIGKSYEEIREMLGPNEGFYLVDTYPTYIIQRGKTHSEETWQLVFKMDRNNRVRDIIMHKNCCEK